ncbi:MAG: nitrate- and nitrite sensing domain-containing protein [Proteobacteria bacterium]|nr:nitrate- and nitrite sensing domain-containing protein [Pseudomonadota bacterium]
MVVSPSAPPPSPAARLALEARRREMDGVRRLAARVELARALGALIHALQRERGASSIYVASCGLRFAETRRAMMADSLAAEAHVRALFDAQQGPEQGASARMLALMAWVTLGMEAMRELRGRIERRALSAHEAVAAFSTFIGGQIELIVHMADAAQLPGVSNLLVAFVHLVQGKEEAGQERAVGALLFASTQCTLPHQQRVVHLIEAQERNLAVFARFVDAPLRERWEAEQLGANTSRLERMRRALCTARAGAALEPRQSDVWFEVCTGRIDMLWTLELALVERLREACDAEIRAAERDLEDSEGMSRALRDHPPARSQHAVERFFDMAGPATRAPEPPQADGGKAGSLLDLVHAQAARMAAMEGELVDARRALHDRKAIERAKGVLMTRLGMTEEAAFRALQKTSMDQNRRMVDVAEATLSLPDEAFAQLAASQHD